MFYSQHAPSTLQCNNWTRLCLEQLIFREFNIKRKRNKNLENIFLTDKNQMFPPVIYHTTNIGTIFLKDHHSKKKIQVLTHKHIYGHPSPTCSTSPPCSASAGVVHTPCPVHPWRKPGGGGSECRLWCIHPVRLHTGNLRSCVDSQSTTQCPPLAYLVKQWF